MRLRVLYKLCLFFFPLCAFGLFAGTITANPAMSDRAAAAQAASQLPGPAGASTSASGQSDVDMRTVAAKKISLTVTDGASYIPAVANALAPTPVSIAVRQPKPFRASLKVSDMPVEDVLRGIAGLEHCELYIFPKYFLIAPPNQLRPDEKAYLAREVSAGDSSGKSDAENYIEL